MKEIQRNSHESLINGTVPLAVTLFVTGLIGVVVWMLAYGILGVGGEVHNRVSTVFGTILGLVGTGVWGFGLGPYMLDASVEHRGKLAHALGAIIPDCGCYHCRENRELLNKRFLEANPHLLDAQKAHLKVVYDAAVAREQARVERMASKAVTIGTRTRELRRTRDDWPDVKPGADGLYYDPR